MGTQHTPKRPIKAVRTTFSIIEALERLGGAGPVEIAEDLNMSQSTVHDHLSTLVSLEYVRKEGRTYRLSLKYLQHGIYARNQLDFFEIARQEVDALAERTGESVWLYTHEFGKAVVLYLSSGENAVQTIGRVGWRADIHTTAAGKAMLSEMPREEVEEIVERQGLAEHTEHTITSKDELFDDIEATRERGYALNDEENNPGIQAVGAPILQGDRVIAAISVSGPEHRFSSAETFEAIQNALADAASQIELRLNYE